MDSFDVKSVIETQKKRRIRKIFSWIAIGFVIAIGLSIAIIAAYGLIAYPINFIKQ